MTDLKTTFAGLQLKNPIIISSSGLTNSAGKNKKLAEAGAGAIVLKHFLRSRYSLKLINLKTPLILKVMIIWLIISENINWPNIWN